jgi:hypothetical protein
MLMRWRHVSHRGRAGESGNGDEHSPHPMTVRSKSSAAQYTAPGPRHFVEPNDKYPGHAQVLPFRSARCSRGRRQDGYPLVKTAGVS